MTMLGSSGSVWGRNVLVFTAQSDVAAWKPSKVNLALNMISLRRSHAKKAEGGGGNAPQETSLLCSMP